MNLLSCSGRLAVGPIAPGLFDNLSTERVSTTESGFLIVYVDNQTIGKDVWFDNVQVLHYNTQVLEENHYYPYGLTVSASAMGITSQPYKYQGIELEKSFGLETYETFYRGLDPQLGRFNSIDLRAEKFYSNSPYVSMGNNPISRVDPIGDSDYRINSNGDLLLVKADDSKTDRLFYNNVKYQKDGTLNEGQTFTTLRKGIIKDSYVGKENSGYSLKITDKETAQEVYDNVKDWTGVEFSIVRFIKKDGSVFSLVSTSKQPGKEMRGGTEVSNVLRNNNEYLMLIDKIEMEHSHPLSNGPMGASKEDRAAFQTHVKLVDAHNISKNREGEDALKVESKYYEQRTKDSYPVDLNSDD